MASRERAREEFEAWVKGILPACSLSRDPDYINAFVQVAWEAWQASAESSKAAKEGV
jgi:hypothetical protein